jgi:hypothetical protein
MLTVNYTYLKFCTNDQAIAKSYFQDAHLITP